MLPATWTAIKKLDPKADTESSLLRLASWWSLQPSQTTGLSSNKGQIAKGFHADLVVCTAVLSRFCLFCSARDVLHMPHVPSESFVVICVNACDVLCCVLL